MVKKYKAFSLIELSIVILIISILLTGVLSAAVFTTNNRKVTQTKEKIDTIYKAMGIFLAKNGYLPCPAPINVSKTDSNYGTAENCTITPSSAGYWKSDDIDSPNLYYGMVPTKTLGISTELSEDAFGAKFAYLVLRGFTAAADFGKGPLSVASSKNYANDSVLERIIIKEKPGASEITKDAAFVIISYGANKSSAWNSNATTQNTVSSDSDEAENDVDNSSGGFDNVVVSSSNDNETFDDIVFYKTRDQLTLDFDLLSLVSCDENATTQNINYGGSGYNFNWNGASTIKYGEIIASNEACSITTTFIKGPNKPTKKCGAFGKWESDVIENCLD